MQLRKIAVSIALAALLSPAAVCAAALTPVDDPLVAPPLETTDVSGGPRSMAEFEGRVVVVNFWATWCPPCVKELPSMQALAERFVGRDFSLLAVNVGEDAQTVSAFLDEFDTRIDFPVLLDEELETVKRWPVFGLPTSFVIDREGNVVYKALGERDWGDEGIVEVIEAMLAGIPVDDADVDGDISSQSQ